jgi:hypothetical protein
MEATLLLFPLRRSGSERTTQWIQSVLLNAAKLHCAGYADWHMHVTLTASAVSNVRDPLQLHVRDGELRILGRP